MIFMKKQFIQHGWQWPLLLPPLPPPHPPSTVSVADGCSFWYYSSHHHHCVSLPAISIQHRNAPHTFNKQV